MRTIILKNNEGERISALSQVMKGALSFYFVIDKYTKVFNTQKEAKQTIKNHVCNKGKYIYKVLNKKQIKALEYLQKRGEGFYKINDFLNLK